MLSTGCKGHGVATKADFFSSGRECCYLYGFSGAKFSGGL